MGQEIRKPGTAWYLAAAGIVLFGCIGGAVMVWRGITKFADAEQFIVPGSIAIEVVDPGDYLIWNDYHTVFQGRAYSDGESLPDGVRFRVSGPDGELTIPGHNVMTSMTSKMGETESVAAASFPAEISGRYEIIVEGEFQPRIFSVGPNNWILGFILVFGGIATTLAALIAGTVLGIWVYYKHHSRNVADREKGVATMNTNGVYRDHEKQQLATLVYVLQAASFLVGITFIAAIIVNYLKRDEVAGTWLESHFNWQIRTFWWSLLWCAIGFVLSIVLVGIFILIADALWVLYRIIKGWLNLNDGKAMYEHA